MGAASVLTCPGSGPGEAPVPRTIGNDGPVKIRFAVSTGGAADPEALGQLVDGAEAAGFDSLWFSDLPVLAATDPFLAVAFAAGRSRRLKLGVNLVPFGYRPYVFARQVAHLDRLTGGRLLVTVVPGVDAPGERAALGTTGVHRGRRMDVLLPLLRRWWAGEAVDADGDGQEVRLAVLPRQDPVEVWLGGAGPEAVGRAGRLADGWLGSLMPPEEAGRIRRAIEAEAERSGRVIDPEHFGLSLVYARGPDDVDRHAGALRALVGRLVDEGLSKFVVRPLGPPTDIGEELDWLAASILHLQT